MTTKHAEANAPYPVPCARTRDPDAMALLRRLDCQHYDDCLDVAIGRRWRNFQCGRCQAYLPLTPTQRYQQYRGILEWLAETQLLSALAREEHLKSLDTAVSSVPEKEVCP